MIDGPPSPRDTISFDAEQDVYCAEFYLPHSPSASVVEVIAAISGLDPTQLPPIYGVVDPDALDELFHPKNDGREPNLAASFTYYGFEITVKSAGKIMVEPRNGG